MADAQGTIEEATARIGQRVASLRTDRMIRVSELARRTGVSSSLISQIERGHSRPSVGTLFALARALDVPVDDFFVDASPETTGDDASSALAPGNGDASVAPGSFDGTRASDGREAPGSNRPRGFPESTDGSGQLPAESRGREVVRRHQRASIEIRGGVRWERLTPTALDGTEFLELVYRPGAESDSQSYRHPGIELVLVTSGVMTIFLGFDQHDLFPGDSIAFPSSTPHRYVNLSDQETRAVTVILRDELSTLALREESASDPPAETSPADQPRLSAFRE